MSKTDILWGFVEANFKHFVERCCWTITVVRLGKIAPNGVPVMSYNRLRTLWTENCWSAVMHHNGPTRSHQFAQLFSFQELPWIVFRKEEREEKMERRKQEYERPWSSPRVKVLISGLTGNSRSGADLENSRRIICVRPIVSYCIRLRYALTPRSLILTTTNVFKSGWRLLCCYDHKWSNSPLGFLETKRAV